jgi:hypothetical protein
MFVSIIAIPSSSAELGILLTRLEKKRREIQVRDRVYSA